MNEHVTLMPPDARGPTARGISSGFPTDLLSQSAARLRVLALRGLEARASRDLHGKGNAEHDEHDAENRDEQSGPDMGVGVRLSELGAAIEQHQTEADNASRQPPWTSP